MGFFSGPSKAVVHKMALGIASVAMQIRILQQVEMDTADKQKILAGMKAEGTPTTMHDLIDAAACVVKEQNMGWLRRNQFLGAIQGHLMVMGMSFADASHLKGLIELKVPFAGR
jgi:hypothetical protein